MAIGSIHWMTSAIQTKTFMGIGAFPLMPPGLNWWTVSLYMQKWNGTGLFQDDHPFHLVPERLLHNHFYWNQFWILWLTFPHIFNVWTSLDTPYVQSPKHNNFSHSSPTWARSIIAGFCLKLHKSLEATEILQSLVLQLRLCYGSYLMRMCLPQGMGKRKELSWCF